MKENLYLIWIDRLYIFYLPVGTCQLESSIDSVKVESTVDDCDFLSWVILYILYYWLIALVDDSAEYSRLVSVHKSGLDIS